MMERAWEAEVVAACRAFAGSQALPLKRLTTTTTTTTTAEERGRGRRGRVPATDTPMASHLDEWPLLLTGGLMLFGLK